jgi:murein DD-endopeptidase MepM/ murein hydrolase activator NlpD
MVHPSQQNSHYAPRKPAWSLILRRSDATRSYRVRPWLAGSVVGFFSLLLVAYVAATAYLVYRDDLLGAAVSHQVRMQYAYEARIAALRSELDRVTSRHAVQTENVEQQLSTLLEQQATIEERQDALETLAGQARGAGVAVAGSADEGGDEAAPLGYAPAAATDGDVTSQLLLKGPRSGKQVALGADGIRPILSGVGASLDRVETHQSDALDVLSAAAGGKEEQMTKALTAIGVKVGDAEDADTVPEGGPFIPAEGMHFVERTALLKKTLDGIETLRSDAAALPLKVPVRARYISSRFGFRVDPFLKRPAFHAGLDFVAEAGTTVYATAPGTVVSAGLSGGYGEMVEIAHADGVSTRYGHLSQILVSAGAHVDTGTPIGLVGSTGRSTGPHLHYETRRDGEAVDPALYLAAGKALHDSITR